jgi:hypothetical protein
MRTYVRMTKGVAWSSEIVEQALSLRSTGSSTYAISRQLGVPRASVANWCRGQVPGRAEDVERCSRCRGRCHDAFEEPAYAYLLGIYLGDGCLTTPGRAVWLCVSMDSAYPGIVAEVQEAIARVLPFRTSHLARPPDKHMVLIRSYGREWLCLFPQHAPGRKHERHIELAEWQKAVVARYPGRFVRGLIHSDGWRGQNRVHVKGRDYSYPRYQFSSRSDDIRGLFTEACDAMGVEWRRWGKWHISVARREAVAALDEHVGLKK